jgi:uncharacterized tellurite resistance protein B-like protein
MSYKPADFAAEIALNGMIHHAYPNVKAELTLLSTAVKADLTHHSREMETPLGILQNPNSYYQAEINLIINKGKAGNLTVAQMGAAMDAVVAAMP